jgi:hypothetical protein
MKTRHWIYLITAVILVLLLFRACKQGCKVMFGPKPNDTIRIERDTVYAPVKKDTVYVPQPYKKIQYVDRWNSTTLEKFDTVINPVDTAAILADYNSTYLYSDTHSVKHGNVVISDTVTKNRIAGRGLKVDLTIPEVTNTITVREEPRGQLYLGLGGAGNKNMPLYGGASLLYKTKRGFMVEGGVLYGNNGTWIYQGGMKFLLSLKKRG